MAPVSDRVLCQPVKGCRPAHGMAGAGITAFEALLHQHKPRAARRSIKCHYHFGFVSARAVLALPGPGEGEAAWRLHDAIDSAGGGLAAVGLEQRGAPAPAGLHVENVDASLAAIRRPPFEELRGLYPEREQN